MESKIWREPFGKRRCLVPASGLYEWPKEGKAISQFYDEVPVEPKESFGVGPFCPTRHAPPRMTTVSPPAISQPHAGNTPVVELVYCPAVQRKRIVEGAVLVDSGILVGYVSFAVALAAGLFAGVPRASVRTNVPSGCLWARRRRSAW